VETFTAVVVSVYLIMVVAEFGDKTNLIALSLMGKHGNPYAVALFATIGIGLTTVLSVVVGSILGDNLPLDPIRYGAAVIFIWLGISTLREDEEDEEIEFENDISPVKIMGLIGLAEFGDKSQILAITAAAASLPVAVFIGSTLGMGTIMFGTAALGSVLFERINPERLEVVGASLFIIAGLWIGISTLLG
jgi:putative Ca2+/H+ antiporter (TMEM165/GDT1 family)